MQLEFGRFFLFAMWLCVCDAWFVWGAGPPPEDGYDRTKWLGAVDVPFFLHRTPSFLVWWAAFPPKGFIYKAASLPVLWAFVCKVHGASCHVHTPLED